MPNAQGGYTYEEEQEAIARAMQAANWNAPPEVNPTPEQQSQQVADNMAAALLANNAGYQSQQDEQKGLLEMLGGQTVGYNLGPPYSESDRAYNGPPPMEAQPDWNYDSGFPGNWHDYNSTNASTGGGFFNIDELYHKRGQQVPTQFQRGSTLPSTNNYRLLPPAFRKPNYIMRNGQVIDMNSLSMYGPFGPDSMGEQTPNWRSGAGAGYPAAWAQGPSAYSIAGWPGQLSPFSSDTGFMGLGGAG